MPAIAIPIIVAMLVSASVLPVQVYHTVSGSMLPTIERGDYLVVFNWVRHFRRGDILLFNFPDEPQSAYVRRLVGLPGDQIQMLDGHLHVNGQPVERTPIDDFIHDGKPVKQWRETLPNGATHRSLDALPHGPLDTTAVFIVPDAHYFMMGDNRDNTIDSRIKSRTAPRENILGRVIFCLFSTCRS